MTWPPNLYTDRELLILKGASKKVKNEGGKFWMARYSSHLVLVMRTNKHAKSLAALAQPTKTMKDHIRKNVTELKSVKPLYAVSGDIVWNKDDSCLDFIGNGNHPNFKKAIRALAVQYKLKGLTQVRLINKDTNVENLMEGEDPGKVPAQDLDDMNIADEEWSAQDQADYEAYMADEETKTQDDIALMKQLLPPIDRSLNKMTQPTTYASIDVMLEEAKEIEKNWSVYPLREYDPSRDPDKPARHRQKSSTSFLNYIRSFAAETGGNCTTDEAHVLKGAKRAKEKAAPKADHNKICDLVRATSVYDDITSAPGGRVGSETKQDFEARFQNWVQNESALGLMKNALALAQTRFTVVRVKNRLRIITAAGYGDVMVSIQSPNGEMICELQLQPKALAELKERHADEEAIAKLRKNTKLPQQISEVEQYLRTQSGHGLYKMLRTVLNGRTIDEITDSTEQGIVRNLMLKSQAFYAEAMQPLTSLAHNIHLIEDIETFARQVSIVR